MKRLLHIKLILISLLMLFSACNEDFWFDFLLGPQPKFIDDNEYAPGLSILGVIRPDSLDSEPLSYVLVEKLIGAVNTEPDSFNIVDAKVMVYKINDNVIVDSFEFIFDTTQLFPSIYRPVDFQPQAGETYTIQCKKEGLPLVTATTTVPDVPIIENDLITIIPNKVQFSILSHPSASLYDVFLFSGNFSIKKRVLKDPNGSTFIDISTNEVLDENAFIIIYVYDANLSSYITAPNIFIKPNTYRPPFSNVSGGYGCFGSMNLMVKNIY
jgi:hypothetical protein